MTRNQIETAVNEGIPFTIKMADGEKYDVNDRYQIALGKTTVIVIGENDMPHILPLLTMTGISCHSKEKNDFDLDKRLQNEIAWPSDYQ